MSKPMPERIWVGTNAYMYSKAHTVGPHTVMRGKAKYILASKYAALEAERDTLKEQLQAVGDIHRAVMSETCPADEFHCTCVPVLRSEIAKLTAERDELNVDNIGMLADITTQADRILYLRRELERSDAEISRLRSSLRGKVDAGKWLGWCARAWVRSMRKSQDPLCDSFDVSPASIYACDVESLLRYIATRAERTKKPSNERA